VGRCCGIDSLWIDEFLDRLNEGKACPERTGMGDEDVPSHTHEKPRSGSEEEGGSVKGTHGEGSGS